MHAPVVTSFMPLATLPDARRLSSNARSLGSGVCGIVCGGSFSRGNDTKPACATVAFTGAGATGATGAAGTPTPVGVDCVAAFAVLSAGAAGAADPTDASFWFAIQLSKSAGVTVNALKRILAWLVPQYSTHAPFHAS